MSHCFYFVLILTIIALQASPSEAACNEGESCIDSNTCPEYKRYLTLTGERRKSEAKLLASKVCNKRLKKICCKDSPNEAVCNEGESCMDSNTCPEYKRFLTLTGERRKSEAKLLASKVCNKKLKKICCKDDSSPETCNTGWKEYPPSFLPPKGQCGVACVGSSSVVHGEDASLGEFPWAALLTTKKVKKKWDNRRKEWVNETIKLNHCGGTLINTWFVLTAAHCHKSKTQISEVVLGEWSTLSDPDCTSESSSSSCDNPRVQKKEVAKVILHQEYDKYNKASPNDIALIRMKTEAQYNIFVQPVCLPLPEYNLKDMFHNPGQYSASATVVGWGASELGNGGSLSQTVLQKHGIFTTNLQKGELQVKPQSECGKISSTQICAGNEITKTDSCRGDSGGGLFINSGDYPGQSFGNVHVQVGLVSYGSKLCGDAPGVYTKVEEFIPWIKEKINFS